MGKTFKDQRDRDHRQGGRPRPVLDEEYNRKNRYYKLNETALDEDEDDEDYSDYDLDYY